MASPQDRSPFDLLPDEILMRIIRMAVDVDHYLMGQKEGWIGSFVRMDTLVSVISNISKR